MTLVLTKVKVQVLNQLTIGEICGDSHIVPKENILWEIHEAEEWWDQKIGASPNKGGANAKAMDKYNGNGALSDDETELLSDDGAADNGQGGVHGFTATHIANIMADDDGELRKQSMSKWQMNQSFIYFFVYFFPAQFHTFFLLFSSL